MTKASVRSAASRRRKRAANASASPVCCDEEEAPNDIALEATEESECVFDSVQQQHSAAESECVFDAVQQQHSTAGSTTTTAQHSATRLSAIEATEGLECAFHAVQQQHSTPRSTTATAHLAVTRLSNGVGSQATHAGEWHNVDSGPCFQNTPSSPISAPGSTRVIDGMCFPRNAGNSNGVSINEQGAVHLEALQDCPADPLIPGSMNRLMGVTFANGPQTDCVQPSPEDVNRSWTCSTMEDPAVTELRAVVDDLGSETREITIHMQQTISTMQHAWKAFLKEEAAVRKSLVSYFDERISCIELSIAAFGESVTGMETNVAAFEADLKGVTSSVAAVNVDLNGMTSNVTAVKADLKGVTLSVAAFEADMKGMTSNVAAFEADLKAVTPSVAAFEADLKGVTSSVAAFETDLKGMTSSVAAVEADMKSFRQQPAFATLRDLEVALQAEALARRELQCGLRGRIEAMAALREGADKDFVRRLDEYQRCEAMARSDLAQRVDATVAQGEQLEQRLKELQHYTIMGLDRCRNRLQTQEQQCQIAFEWTKDRLSSKGRGRACAVIRAPSPGR